MRQKLALVVAGVVGRAQPDEGVLAGQNEAVRVIAHVRLNGTARGHACGADATATGACEAFASIGPVDTALYDNLVCMDIAGATSSSGGKARMAKAAHSMVRVLDEARSTAFYCQAFGLEVADRLDFPNFTLVYLRNGEADFEVELTINKDRTAPYELGDGYGHIAFVTDDLDAEHARFKALGFTPRDIVEFKHEGELIARFFFVQDPDGYKIEMLQKHGRYR
jgi:lactoylglutathione lyase